MEPDLSQAQHLILDALPAPLQKSVDLACVQGRFPLSPLTASIPIPAFSQSTRDGYVFRFNDVIGKKMVRLPVTDEVAAGRPSASKIRPRTAMRIMTGGAVPSGGNCVLPFEDCREEEGVLVIRPRSSIRPDQFIRRRGSEVRLGKVLVPQGERIRLDLLPYLAEAGHDQVVVGRRPRVAFVCTGSELVENGANIQTGQKVSGNRFLLEGMIAEAGGVPENFGPVSDCRKQARAALEQTLASRPDIIVTTGGMGPGKYDFVSEIFQRLGGRVLYSSLKVRPGRATMFGLLDGVPFFGLPGPPPVVRLLFFELVVPAILALQGAKHPLPHVRRVLLHEDIACRRGILNLKGGVVEDGPSGRIARRARSLEPLNAVLLLPGHRRRLKAGERVTVHCIQDR